MPSQFPCRGVSRRELLRIGSAGLMGITLPRLLAAANPTSDLAARADSLIILFLNGGPSHLDMWDMKPDGPAEIRGQFQPIATSLPGVQFCEHLPQLARHMHHCTLARAMHHSVNNAHALAVYTAMTGHDRGDANRIVGNSAEDHPAPGAVASRLLPHAAEVVPHVALPYKTKEGAGGPPQPGFFGGWLGSAHDPLWVLKDPNADDFSVPELTLPAGFHPERLVQRSELLSRLNAGLDSHDRRGLLESMNRFQGRALDVLTSRRVQDAFRITREPDSVRDAYGRNIYGQSVLLARRLIEAGTRVATISWAPDANATWDTHGGNFQKLKESLLPQFDMACASLLGDLEQRGMLDRTLVAVLGDFGRTPKINNNNAGRDHWNYCYTIMLAGGGIRPGYVHGASDRQGAFPADQPMTPADVVATIYHLLGIDPHQQLYDRFDRPHQLVAAGQVVPSLLG